MRESRHRKSAVPIGRTFGIVVLIHVLGGVALVLLAQTEYGQKMMKTYKVSLMKQEEPPPPPEEEPPPPPPPPEPADAPEVPDAPAPEVAAGPEIAGTGGLAVGGKFLGPAEGPLGAFHASVERRFRKHYQQPDGEFRPAEVVFSVGASGAVGGYRLRRSSGDPANDEAVLAAAAELQREGVSPPPEGKARSVLVKVIPY